MPQHVVVLTPEANTADAITVVLSSQNVGKMLGRMVAFFDPKCDEEAKTYSTQSFHKRIPFLVKERLVNFTTAIDAIMAEGRDFCVIMEGRTAQWTAKSIITEILTANRLGDNAY